MAVIDQRLCACGSGLRTVRCCALDLATVGAPEADRHLVPLVERAVQANRRGAGETAERLCLEILELSPGQRDSLWMLSRLRDAQGSPAAAEALVRRLVALNPNGVPATQDLALRLLRKGALAEAELHARNGVRIAPTDPQSHNLLGMVLTESHQLQPAEFHYRRVLELTAERDPIVLANLAWCLKQQGRVEEARQLYEESVAAAPDVLHTVLGWARLEEVDRDFARAEALLARADAIAADEPSVKIARAVVHGRKGETAAALALLDEVREARGEAGLPPEQLLEQGRLFDRLGRYDDAFAAFTQGKRLARELSGHAYLADHAEQLAARLKGFFTAERLLTLPKAGVRADVAQPLFILGFPRSGTTLLEQMLSAHPAIEAGDELPFVAALADALPRMLTSPLDYPEALAELWMGDRREELDNLRDQYLQRARQRGLMAAGAAMFTDKMPLNETHLGLIGLMFPAAPLIYVQRHPLDVMVSVISNQLTHGFFCGYDLETAARHYVLIADLVAHYRKEMALRLLPVRYEDVIADQAREVRRILDFVGLPFDPRCLSSHENRRYARTASYAQVAEPLYDRSAGRWRRYRTHLEPVIPILRPLIERLGYDLD